MSNWECSICLIENDHLDTNTEKPRYDCEACESVRPGYTKPTVLIKDNSRGLIGGEGAALLFGSAPDEANNKTKLFQSSSTTGIQFGAKTTKSATERDETEDVINDEKQSYTLSSILTKTNKSNGAESSGIRFGDCGAMRQNITPERSTENATGKESGLEHGSAKLSQSIEAELESLEEDVKAVLGQVESYKDGLKGLDTGRDFSKDGDLTGGRLLLWGSGECDQLPLQEDVLDQEGGVVKPISNAKLDKYDLTSISCGALHTVVLLSDGRVATFGCDDDKALGRVITAVGKERFPGIMKYEDQTPIDNAIAVCAGNSHTMVLTKDGSVLVAGRYKSSSSAKVAINNSTFPTAVPLPSKGIGIASGDEHSVAICKSDEGEIKIYVWGINESGALGRQSQENPNQTHLEEMMVPTQLDPPEGWTAMWAYAGSNTTVLKCQKAGGDVSYFACGCNGTGEVGVGSSDTTIEELREIPELRNLDIKKIVLSSYSAKALLNDGSMYSWGHPEYTGDPHLGNTREPIRSPRKIQGIPKLRDLWAGSRTTMGVTLKNERQVLGWGDSITGQLMKEMDESVLQPISLEELKDKVIISMGLGSQHCGAIVADPIPETVFQPTPSRKRTRAEDSETPTRKYLRGDAIDTARSSVLREYPIRVRKNVPKFSF